MRDQLRFAPGLDEEWLVPERDDAELAFSEADVARAQLISDLIADMGVNSEGVSVILHLVDQMHGLRSVVADLLASAKDKSGTKP